MKIRRKDVLPTEVGMKKLPKSANVAILDGYATTLLAGSMMEFKTEVEIRSFLPKFIGMKIRRKDALPTEVGIKKLPKSATFAGKWLLHQFLLWSLRILPPS